MQWMNWFERGAFVAFAFAVAFLAWAICRVAGIADEVLSGDQPGSVPLDDQGEPLSERDLEYWQRRG